MTDLEVNEASPIRPSANVLLTTRDLGLLLSLYENVVMTFSQVQKRHFREAKKPTVLNRLSKLESAGLIRRERIPKMRLGLDDQAVGVVFQVTRDGISELKSRHKDKEFKAHPVRIHPYTLHHDLVLVDLSGALKVLWPSAQVVNGKHLFQHGQGTKGLEPDLVVQLPEVPGQLAIELELSDKSEHRYREIVLRYRLSREYDKALYFVGQPFIQSIMTKVILNRNPHPDEKPDTGKFYFASAMEFINRPSSTPISNGVNDLGQKGGL